MIPSVKTAQMYSKIFSFIVFLSAVAMAQASASPSSQAEWERVAVSGVEAAHRGDGAAFAKIIHPNFINFLKKSWVARLNAGTDKEKTDKTLQKFGVSSAEEIDSIPSEKFAQVAIEAGFAELSPEDQASQKGAEFKVVKSEKLPDGYAVDLQALFPSRDDVDKPDIRTLRVFVSEHNGVWKYNGIP
jgi:hypothetical protein